MLTVDALRRIFPRVQVLLSNSGYGYGRCSGSSLVESLSTGPPNRTSWGISDEGTGLRSGLVVSNSGEIRRVPCLPEGRCCVCV